ncbi:c-type cytochrome [Elioraea sp.]|uniref:c-type cytochrome n=1 Tax=Elioraea sp. TaxID=2185103 RepID=UPI0025C41B0D|nr:c-type cytochrome [Elioraea sp.]
MLPAVVIAALMVSLPALAQGPDRPLAALSCGGCHGVGSAGQGPIAPLAGRPKAELVAAMTAFRRDERPGTIMGRIARGYTDAEIDAIAADLAARR